MEAVVGLLVLLLGVSQGVETHCDGRQDGAQCYGALGGTVVLQLMDRASDIFRYRWKKNNTIKLYGRKNTILSNLIEDRSLFTPSNGTFRINHLSRTDDGEYTLEIFDSNGRMSEERTLQLSIQGCIFINCTLSNGTNISQWVLSATNTLCIDPTTTPTMVPDTRTSTVDNSLLVCGLRAAVAFVLLVGIVIYFAWKKKKYKKAETSTIQRTTDHPENSFAMVEL